jgi:anti-sigma factor RsiW
MSKCRDIESILTAYVDGEAAADERGTVETHLDDCPSCRNRVAAERTAHELISARRADLRGSASTALRQRCAAQRAPARTRPGVFGRQAVVRLALAATVVFAVGLYAMFGWGTTVETYAAQLAVDHMKCFQFPPDGGKADAATLARKWQRDYGWPLKVAGSANAEQLELLGVRRCGSTWGRVAHVLYKWRGEPVSLYVLNDQIAEAADVSHAHSSVTRFGERAIIWSERGRTYAVVARRQVPDLDHVAGYVRRAIE